MGRAQIKKKSTFIDMTAMSDVTVLLLTFFMLTSTFVKKEPVQVTTPASVSEIKIPETNVLQILVDPEGKIKIAEIQDNNIGRNADELFRKVQAAQFVASHPGDVCPAKWKEGAETLKPSIDLVGKL